MAQKNDTCFHLLWSSSRQGIKKGWGAFLWLIRILVPISFFTALCIHFKLIYLMDPLLRPLMEWIGLPAHAAVVILIGFFTGIYGTVGALSAANFSVDQMTLIAIFSLICHNLVAEGIVQGKSGMHAAVAVSFRLLAAFVVTFICARVMGVDADAFAGPALPGAVGSTSATWMAALKTWGWATVKLVGQIFCIVMPLMVLLETAKSTNLISRLTHFLKPLLRFMGLDQSTGVLWFTAVIFGLAYGAAVIVEEVRAQNIAPRDLERLHLSIGINHSMIEDPALFLPLGLSAFWLWVPRLIASIGVAWAHRAFHRIREYHA